MTNNKNIFKIKGKIYEKEEMSTNNEQ